ncbi:MAG: alpha/beta hydrolase [Treponema sp.]|nr:alpha/beta hydrolase [Treponema sp.]
MKKLFTLVSAVLILAAKGFSQDQTIYLWKNVKGMEKQPSVMFMHKAADDAPKTGSAVIVCPGGSYHHLGLRSEGNTTAVWFAKNGVTAFMLKYRTAESTYHYPAMLQDIQRAIQIVRERADEFGIDPSKVGLIGFSAGGHLVTMAGEFYQTHNELLPLGINTEVNLRPDFIIPVYPVVSMQDDIAHRWSRKSLLGSGSKRQSQERKNEFSMELNVPDDMPPTYVVVCDDDPVVIPENSLRLYDALQAKNINSRLARYEWGGHGFGMMNNDFMQTFHWNESLRKWLVELGFMK